MTRDLDAPESQPHLIRFGAHLSPPLLSLPYPRVARPSPRSRDNRPAASRCFTCRASNRQLWSVPSTALRFRRLAAHMPCRAPHIDCSLARPASSWGQSRPHSLTFLRPALSLLIICPFHLCALLAEGRRSSSAPITAFLLTVQSLVARSRGPVRRSSSTIAPQHSLVGPDRCADRRWRHGGKEADARGEGRPGPAGRL